MSGEDVVAAVGFMLLCMILLLTIGTTACHEGGRQTCEQVQRVLLAAHQTEAASLAAVVGECAK